MGLEEYAKPIDLRAKSDVGVLLIHGFTSTPDSVRYLAEKLHEAGYNVMTPVLSGHCTEWTDLNKVKFQDWINDVETMFHDLKKIAGKIFVAGLSLGGTLAMYLAETYPGLAGIIPINHGLFLQNDPRLFFLPLLRFIVPSSDAVGGDLKDQSAKEITYSRSPLNGIYELMKIFKLVRLNLGNVLEPILIFKSKEDHVLSIKNATYTYENISSKDKTLIWLENSYHVATQDFDKDLIAEKSIEFINRITKGRNK